MRKLNLAAIDIGSNAVRLLIKCVNSDLSEQPLSKVQLLRVPLRLGEDAFISGQISKRKQRDILSLMKVYKHLMKIYDVAHYRTCATSAMREASNAQEIVDKVLRKTGIQIEVISGEEEAALVAQSKVHRIVTTDRNYLFMDVGGGSTELNLYVGGEPVATRSFDIGTVRMLSGVVREATFEAFDQYLAELYSQYGAATIVGTGGNINRLARLNGTTDLTKPDTRFISAEALQEIYETLAALTDEQRMTRFNLKPDRSDVIVPAGELFTRVVAALHADQVIVPTIGVADGIIDQLYLKIMN
ncbi:MAG: Ppx/GppA family phosphatase [Porphyromonas sp.]|uniref:Ppx/GppA phosphatase family protein n=1 Tax=Porphyromonas sp. TaxID=1924944 RepID=UPI002A7FF2CF|nr:Ppx/GppA family phosphatase [Porphyromonas sp.]MDY4245814.1 Ppx/GppA family phosphatase [Porphyromonas sp.]